MVLIYLRSICLGAALCGCRFDGIVLLYFSAQRGHALDPRHFITTPETILPWFTHEVINTKAFGRGFTIITYGSAVEYLGPRFKHFSFTAVYVLSPGGTRPDCSMVIILPSPVQP